MKVNNFPELIKYIRNEILSPDDNQLDVQFWDNEIVFGIYDSFDVTINVMEHDVYNIETHDSTKQIMPELVTEVMNSNLTTDELKDCYKICEFLEENIDILEEMIK